LPKFLATTYSPQKFAKWRSNFAVTQWRTFRIVNQSDLRALWTDRL